ncbi:MAG: hypothetical protein GC206_05815 [Alphaproteobacteria bacterium]|nr:hypothetical protein [Alphaproteobacteria bacterium]
MPLSYLSLLLAFKIVVTLVAVSGPLLAAPRAFVLARAGLEPAAAPWLRLYGVAVTALLVGYASGFFIIAQGAFPWGVVVMGFVSNAGAVTAMVATGLARRAPILASVFALIALGLLLAAAFPNVAIAAF